MKVPNEDVNLSVTITPELPAYSTGYAIYGDPVDMLVDITEDFEPVVKSYASGDPITGAITGCRGKCSASIHAPALAVDACNSTTKYIDFSTPLTPKEIEIYKNSGVIGNRFVFTTWFVHR